MKRDRFGFDLIAVSLVMLFGPLVLAAVALMVYLAWQVRS
jgi:hypothetical protein